MNRDGSNPQESTPHAFSPWRLVGWLCAGVIAISVVACLVMAGMRSTGLTQITVTVLDAALEPRDHKLPLIKKKEALPDYELALRLTDGRIVRLGTKPDMSAVEGLTWNVAEPVSLRDIASVKLQDEDKLVSDAIAEVQILGETTTENGYRFDFVCERSLSIGVRSFFDTPVGQAIAAGFCIAVLLMLFSVFHV